MKKSMCALLLLSTALGASAAEAIGFKGVPLGAAKESLLGKFTLQCEKPPPLFWDLGDENCTPIPAVDSGVGQYAGAPAWGHSFFITDGRLEKFQLTVRADTYDDIKAALVEAYGRGKESTREIHLRTGAVFPSRTWTVSIGGSTLELMEHGGRITEGAVVATSAAYTRWKDAKSGRDAKKNAKDI